MRPATRNIALAAVVTAIAACPDMCTDFSFGDGEETTLGEDEARTVLSGLIEMANEAEQGTTYACPSGGQATTTVTVTSEQVGDSGLYRFEKRELGLSGCSGLAVGYPDLPIDGDVEFASRTTIFDSGRGRFKTWVIGRRRAGTSAKARCGAGTIRPSGVEPRSGHRLCLRSRICPYDGGWFRSGRYLSQSEV